MALEGLCASECLLTTWNIGTNTTTQSQGECMMQKRPMQLLREELCAVESAEE